MSDTSLRFSAFGIEEKNVNAELLNTRELQIAANTARVLFLESSKKLYYTGDKDKEVPFIILTIYLEG